MEVRWHQHITRTCFIIVEYITEILVLEHIESRVFQYLFYDMNIRKEMRSN